MVKESSRKYRIEPITNEPEPRKHKPPTPQIQPVGLSGNGNGHKPNNPVHDYTIFHISQAVDRNRDSNMVELFNGEVVVDGGVHTGARSGQILKKDR